ncbi:MAG: hypothetical protein WEA99_02340 [Brumimicrobium sp.]
MEKYQFKVDQERINNLTSSNKIPKHGSFIYVFHADKIPPHIGFVIDTKFYSVKANGVDLALNISKILHLVQHKKIPTLIFELDEIKANEQLIYNIFKSYENKLSEGKTCLNPIDELIFKCVKHSKIGELINTLENQSKIKQIYGLNINSSFLGILNYSKNDIEKRIFELKC